MKKRNGFIDPVSLSLIVGGSIFGTLISLVALSTICTNGVAFASILKRSKIQIHKKTTTETNNINRNVIPVSVDQEALGRRVS